MYATTHYNQENGSHKNGLPLMDRKAQFFKTYANLPQASREEIIAVIDGEPYIWQSARREIEGAKPIGMKILDLLSQ
jgi:hypothetical protein